MDLISLPAVVVGAVVVHDTHPDNQRVTRADWRYREREREVRINVVVRDIDPCLPHGFIGPGVAVGAVEGKLGSRGERRISSAADLAR